MTTQKILAAIVLAFSLSACTIDPHPVYFKDATTDLCFARPDNGWEMTNVPCTPAVESAVKRHKTSLLPLS